ncbi:hypothetical protein TNCV_374551 [Trichonephila clavipes]|nr:hypothetical protein TNCV_374551 [Trichonephila clavipes]
MAAQMTAVKQVSIFKCSCELHHQAPNEDISDHVLLCKSESFYCPVPLLKFIPTILGHSVDNNQIPRNYESWPNDKDDTKLANHSLKFHAPSV